MKRVTSTGLERAFQELGIRSGDHLLVHSELLRLGLPEKGVSTYVEALFDAVGPQGTIAVPTFSFSFLEAGEYHWRDTPSVQMGALSEAIRKLPDARRSRHPIQSISAVGHHADHLARIETPSAYQADGIFQEMCDLDFKVLLLGAGPIHISHSHLCEELAQVPYRFNKIVEGEATLGPHETGKWAQWHFFARDLELNVFPEGEAEIVDMLVETGQWSTSKFNGIVLYRGMASSFVRALDRKLEEDAWWMIPEPQKRELKID